MCTGFEGFLIGTAIAGAIAGGTTAIVSASSSGQQQAPEMPALPQLPQPAVIKDEAKKDAQRRAAMKSKTVLTSGAGVVDDPKLAKKTLLGG